MEKTDFPRGSSLAVRIFQVEADLEKQKRIMSSVSLSVLPDKGDRLKKKMEDLQNLLKSLTLESKSDRSACDEKEQPSEIVSEKETILPTHTVKNAVKINQGFSKSGPSNISSNGTSVQSSCSKSKEISTSFSKNNCSDFPSFEKLSSTLPVTDSQLDNLYQSPSFKSFRHTQNIPSIKLTEAKPLFETKSSGKSQNIVYSAALPHSKPSEDSVLKLHHALSVFPEDTEEEIEPALLLNPLLQHQVTGLTWMVWREGQQPSGGILADDMGLGKTLSLIALILKQKEAGNYLADGTKNTTRCTLVVCLASILHQWNHEIQKHCRPDALRVLLYHGPKRERSIQQMRSYDVVLTTYSLLQSERKNQKESGLFNLHWERVILDEAHSIKNVTSKTAEAAFSLHAFRRWCATGTPIHNNLGDMHALVRFLRFAPFDDRNKWKKLVEDKTDASQERMRLLVKSLMLRRTKEDMDVMGKPLVHMVQKNISVCYFELSDEERCVYDRLNARVQEILDKYLRKATQKLTCSNLLVLLLRLQQCCSHTSLLGKAAIEDVADDSTDSLLTSLSALTLGGSSSSDADSGLDLTFSSFQESDLSDLLFRSTKLQKLLDALTKIAEESDNAAKSVVVSQWVSMLDIVAKHLQQDGVRFLRISGNTKVEDRQKASHDLNNNKQGPKVLLLSLKAGGTGLNLVGASHLFLLDLHWNPALEKQACDRIHRVGQTKDVFIHKFVCRNTIEERILQLQNKKSEDASDVLQGGSRVTKGLSMEYFKTLFDVPL